ncbi:MAG: hypothetical protein AAB428_03625, partial [Patescibacteria group bacterium]
MNKTANKHPHIFALTVFLLGILFLSFGEPVYAATSDSSPGNNLVFISASFVDNVTEGFRAVSDAVSNTFSNRGTPESASLIKETPSPVSPKSDTGGLSLSKAGAFAAASLASVSSAISSFTNNVSDSISGSIQDVVDSFRVNSSKTPALAPLNQPVPKDNNTNNTEETPTVAVPPVSNNSSLIGDVAELKKEVNRLQSRFLAISASGPITQNTTERVVERTVSGVSQADLNKLENSLKSEIYKVSSSASSQTSSVYQAMALSNRINKLDTVAVTGATITGSSFAGSVSGTSGSFSDTLSVTGAAAFSSALSAGVTTLTTLSAGTTTLTNLTVSNTSTSTFAGRLLLSLSPTIAHTFSSWTSGASDANPLGASLVINPASATTDSNLLSLSVNNSAKFLIDAEGDVFANSLTAVGGVTLSTTTASTFSVEGTTTLGDATTTDKTYFNSRIGSSLIPTVTNLLDLGDTANGLAWRTGLFGTSVGIGTTTPYSKLTTWGTGSLFEAVTNASTTVFSIGQGGATSTAFFSTTASSTNLFSQTATFGVLSASGLTTFINGFLSNASSTITSGLFTMSGGASTTNITASGIGYFGTASATNLTVSGSPSGVLVTNSSGAVSASTTLGVNIGGTGWSSIQSGAITYGNGTGALSTTTAGTAGYVLALNGTTPTWVATTTYSSGLTYAAGGVTNTGALSLGVTGTALTGALTIATSSTAFNGLTASTTVTGSGTTLTFANALAGLLGVGGGGTGLSSIGDGTILFGGVGGGTANLTALATTSGAGRFLTLDYSTGRPSWTATSTVFGTGTGGQVLAWNNGVPQFVATTTYSSGLTYAAGGVT